MSSDKNTLYAQIRNGLYEVIRVLNFSDVF